METSKKVNILGINFNNITMNNAVDESLKFLEGNEPKAIFTPNPEMAMLAKSDNDFRNVLNSADLIVADGIGIVWASKKTGEPLYERVAGYDLVQGIFAKLEGRTKVFFLGAAPTVAEKAAINMQKKYPNLNIVGWQDGYFKDENAVIEKINAANADFILVGLGMKRQEEFILRNKERLGARLLIGVGGSFDVMSGHLKRAPVFMQKMGLEWAFRLLMQPKRIWRQRILVKFVFRVLFKGVKI